LPDQQFKAQVKRMAGAIDNRLRSERIEMDVANNDKKLLPGMVAEVNLPLPASDSTFIVPKTAVINSTESVFVIRIVNNQTQRVDVKTGRDANDYVEIYGKLNDGDLLLISASDEIKNGTVLQNVKTVAL
jgi:multidrug efflux pump subunit AcrA (membrane-fusion protein)